MRSGGALPGWVGEARHADDTGPSPVHLAHGSLTELRARFSAGSVPSRLFLFLIRLSGASMGSGWLGGSVHGTQGVAVGFLRQAGPMTP